MEDGFIWKNSKIYPKDRIITAKDDKLFSEHFRKTVDELSKYDYNSLSIDHSLVRGLTRYQNIIHLLLGSKNDQAAKENYRKAYYGYFYKYSDEIIYIFTILFKKRFFKGDSYPIAKGLKNLISKTRLAGTVDDYLNNIDGLIISLLKQYESGSNAYPNALLNDNSKIMSSSAFRRLQDKAQIFPLEPNDYVRTRLTHSMEVVSISRSIANIVVKRLRKRNVVSALLYDLENTIECVSLIHDIGNPPFGHYGEQVIQNFFHNNWDKLKDTECNDEADNLFRYKDGQMYYDFVCFDGNAQSLRVVTKLQRYRYGHPLELSAGILGGLIKYPFDSTVGKNKRKIGYFYSENDIAAQMRALGVLKNNYRNPVSLLLEAADDISYSIADLDDAIKKGVITKELFESAIDKYEKNAKENLASKEEKRFEKLADISAEPKEDKRYNCLLKFFNDYREYYRINFEKQGDQTFTYTLSLMLYDLKRKMIFHAADSFCSHYSEIMRGIYYDGSKSNASNVELLKLDDSDEIIIFDWIGKYLKKPFVYMSHDVITAEIKGESVLTTLLEEFAQAMLNLDFRKDKYGEREALDNNNSKYKRVFNLISKNFVDNFYSEYDLAKNQCEKTYYKLKLVVDYISGMTDSYALDIYQAIKGIK